MCVCVCLAETATDSRCRVVTWTDERGDHDQKSHAARDRCHHETCHTKVLHGHTDIDRRTQTGALTRPATQRYYTGTQTDTDRQTDRDRCPHKTCRTKVHRQPQTDVICTM